MSSAEERDREEVRPLEEQAGEAVVGEWDRLLLVTILLLVGVGVVMIYSSSAVFSLDSFNDPGHFLKRHLISIAAGMVAMMVMMRFDYRGLIPYTYPLLFGCLFLLILVMVPGLGAKAGGAQRWFRLFGFSFQPSELAKVSIILYLSYSISKKAERIRTFSIGLLPHLLIVGIMILLTLMQPDFGTAVTILAMMFCMLFIAGAKISYILGLGLAALPVGWHLIVSSPYRMRRFLAFWDPWKYPFSEGYQVRESLISIGSGGPFGLGLGDGRQKLYYLPAAHTDFILSTVAEELGFVGVVTILGLFALLLARGFHIARKTRDAYGTHIAIGITTMIGLQVAINTAVVMGLLPTKGLTLPFISFGGSSMVISLAAMGLLLNVSRYRRPGLVPQDDLERTIRHREQGR